MSKPIKIAFLVGIIITIAGSFLPWDRGTQGFYSSGFDVRYQFYPPEISDSGGGLIICLSILLILHVFRPLNFFLVKPAIWNIVISAVLVGVALYNGNDFLNVYIMAGVNSKPPVGIGLLMVIFGSIFLLLTAILFHRQDISHKDGLAERFDQRVIAEERDYFAVDPSRAVQQDFMHKDLKIGYLIGASLSVLGSFLPWWTRPGFSSLTYCGVHPFFCFGSTRTWGTTVVDGYGGYPIIVLSIILFMLQFRPKRAAFERIMWNNILACSVFTLAIYYFSGFMLSRILFLPITVFYVDPTLRIGLELVLLGASLQLLTAAIQYRRNM